MKDLIRKCQYRVNDRKILIDILAVLFGIGTWVGINSIFLQLPLLVKTAPEGWNLPSYMSIAVQIANIGPIMYAVFRKIFPSGASDKYWVLSMLLISVITPILMAFYYDHNTFIFGQERSFFFLILVFFTSLVGCTSSVLFYPYMRHFKEIYIISYFIGEGLSGFVPSALGLVQGAGGNPMCVEDNIGGNVTISLEYNDPRFSTKTFFFVNALISFISLCSFMLLINLKSCKEEEESSKKINKDSQKNYQLTRIHADEDYGNIDKQSDTTSHCQSLNDVKVLSRMKLACLLILVALVNAFGNGVFPSIQSYSCLPYGNTAYHLAVALGSMANPTACFIALFLPRTSNKAISILTVACSVFTGYLLTTSIMSPDPPLLGYTSGVAIVIIGWIAAVGLVSYIKLCISTIFRTQGGTWMFYCGASSQLGSAIGSLITFVLINYTQIFVPSDPCRKL